jgi:tetratricopeptide (TPR) repeat protein
MKHKGAITLLMVTVLVILASITGLFTARSVLSERWGNSNSLWAAQAQLTAQAALETALAQIEHGIALDPSFPPIAEYNRAVALELLGRTREAYESYRKALLMDGSFAQASERLRNFTVLRRTTTPPAN